MAIVSNFITLNMLTIANNFIQLQKLWLLIERTSIGSVPGTVIPKSNSLLLFSPFATNRRIKGIICFKVIPDSINPILSNDVFGIYKKDYLLIIRGLIIIELTFSFGLLSSNVIVHPLCITVLLNF